jgi:hypothetical protein
MGENISKWSPQVEGLLHDLMLGGVQVEVTDTPANWKAPAKQPARTAAATPSQNPSPEPRTSSLTSRPSRTSREQVANAVLAEAPLPRTVPQVQAVASGEPGGVVIACFNAPTTAEAALLGNMLKAVGLHERPRAIVAGNTGMAACIATQQPTHLLVLGQAPLSALQGQISKRPLGVEEWQRAPSPLLENFAGPVGVTYPLDLLLKNPLYKKRAWQHLLKWTA